MASFIDILDTSIKIGLGACISGLTAYFVSRKGQQHEMKTNHLNSKKELLQQCVSNINKSTATIYPALQNLYNVCYSNEFFSLVHFNEEFEKYMIGLNFARESRSIAYLINEPKLGELIGELIEIIVERGYHIQDNKQKYSVKKINELNQQASKLGEEILTQYGQIFNRLYKQ
jgi:hypothetical protein